MVCTKDGWVGRARDQDKKARIKGVVLILSAAETHWKGLGS